VFEYVVSTDLEGKSVIFTFTARDDGGAITKSVNRVIVAANQIGPILLTETTGHKMHSKNSQNTDAYNIETGTAEFSTLSDSTDRDMEDNPASDTVSTLSLSWISPAGGQFVKFNTFDYPNATDSSLRDAYDAGIALSKVDNIQAGDIILTKLGDTTGSSYATIQVTSINDPDSTNLDFYLFNIKK